MTDLTADQVEAFEQLLRTMRRRTAMAIAVVVVLAVTLATSIFAVLTSRYDADATRFNATTTASLKSELAIERQQADAQAKLYSQFLQDFTAEEDYVCRVAAAFAVQNGLEPPKPGLCTVTLPTPRPSAPASLAPTTSPSRGTTVPPRASAGVLTPATSGAAPSTPKAKPTPLFGLPLPSMPALPSLPLASSAHRNATSRHHCGPVAVVIGALLHGRC